MARKSNVLVTNMPGFRASPVSVQIDFADHGLCLIYCGAKHSQHMWCVPMVSRIH